MQPLQNQWQCYFPKHPFESQEMRHNELRPNTQFLLVVLGCTCKRHLPKEKNSQNQSIDQSQRQHYASYCALHKQFLLANQTAWDARPSKRLDDVQPQNYSRKLLDWRRGQQSKQHHRTLESISPNSTLRKDPLQKCYKFDFCRAKWEWQKKTSCVNQN